MRYLIQLKKGEKMRGYPKNIATKQDYINLLNTKEFKEKAVQDLKKICNYEEEKTFKVTEFTVSPSNEKKYRVELITNPKPPWKTKGFYNIQDVENIIRDLGNAVPPPKTIDWNIKLKERQDSIDLEAIKNKEV